jgi:phenylpyruvate tautomerase PptA (4-oxalocrotonate tautomerase family)
VLSPEKRRELIAAISAVIAEELGKDVSAIRVTSFRKL